MGLINDIQPITTGNFSFGSVYSLVTTDSDQATITAAGYINSILDMKVPYTQRKILPGSFVELKTNSEKKPDCFCYWVAYAPEAETYTLVLNELVGNGSFFPPLPSTTTTVIGSGTAVWSGGAASLNVTVTGAAAEDIVLITPVVIPTTFSWVTGVISASATLTLTIAAADATNVGIYNYVVLRG